MTSGNTGGGAGSTLPYLGSKISLISYAGIRYEGVLFNINTRESTVGLSNVRSFGTEGRKPGTEVPACDDVFDFIVFRGKDIQDLTVTEPANHPQDPAIVAINPGPHMGGGPDYGSTGRGFHAPFGRFPGGAGHYGVHRGNGGVGHHPFQSSLRGGSGRGRGGYGSGGYGGYNSRTIVGELRPQPNQTLKSQLGQAFDFEEGNRRFEKAAATTTEASGDSVAGASGDNGKENEVSPTLPKAGYNRAASFFDTISCEALDRQSGVDTRVDRQKQRVLDAATFGSAAALPMRRGRGYRRTTFRRNNNNGPAATTGGQANMVNSLPQVGFSGRRF